MLVVSFDPLLANLEPHYKQNKANKSKIVPISGERNSLGVQGPFKIVRSLLYKPRRMTSMYIMRHL